MVIVCRIDHRKKINTAMSRLQCGSIFHRRIVAVTPGQLMERKMNELVNQSIHHSIILQQTEFSRHPRPRSLQNLPKMPARRR